MKKLVLIGGGHAHLVTLSRLHVFLAQGYDITVIGPSMFHYYSGMGPGMLGGSYTAADIRFATSKVVEMKGGTFIQGLVDRIDPHRKIVILESGESVSYDVLSCNSGSYVDKSCVVADKGDIFSVKPIEKLMRARERILEFGSRGDVTVGIVGGGPSSAEIAGNVFQLLKGRSVKKIRVIIFSGKEFMAGSPSRVRKLVFEALEKKGTRIHEHCRVAEVETGKITLDDGQVFDVDLVFLAMGVKPSSIFVKSGLPVGPDGGLRVNRFLQCIEHPEIFGGGDCIYFEEQPLDKVGVYAVRENSVLCENLMASMGDMELHSFDPGRGYLMIFNLGQGYGVLRKFGITFAGRLAFFLKDYIDRRFMNHFQSLEK